MAEDDNRTRNLCGTDIRLNDDIPPTSKLMTYEELFIQLGGFGRFQIRTYILINLFDIPAALYMLLPILTHDDPKLVCPSTLNTSALLNDSLFSHNSSNLNSLDNSTTYCTNICDRGGYFNEPFTSILSEWCLYGRKKFIPSLITSIQMFGVLVGALVTGQLADLYGRRKTMFVTYTLLLVFSLVSAFSVSWPMYAAFRFFIGVQLGGLLVVSLVLPMEFLLPAHRTFCGAVGFWAIGFMLVGFWGYFIQQWRMLIIATSVSGIPLLFTWKWIPESPRWLFYNGYTTQAKKILDNIAITNHRPLPHITNLARFFEVENIKENKRKLRYSYWHLFSSKRLAVTSLILMYLWFVGSAVYYGMSLNTSSLSGNRYLNIFLSALVEIPPKIYILVVNNRLGRKKTICSLMLTCSLFCFGILVLDIIGLSKELNSVPVGFSFIGKAAIVGAWTVTSILSSECFPTVIRNIGIASSSMAARIGGIVAPQIVLLTEFSASIPFTVFGIMSLLAAILTCVLPEKNNTPLPDVLEDAAKKYSVSCSDGGVVTLNSLVVVENEEIVFETVS